MRTQTQTQSKTMVSIMMALKDMRRITNCDNKETTRKKKKQRAVERRKKLVREWWKCKQAAEQLNISTSHKWLIQLIDCALMCFKIVYLVRWTIIVLAFGVSLFFTRMTDRTLSSVRENMNRMRINARWSMIVHLCLHSNANWPFCFSALITNNNDWQYFFLFRFSFCFRFFVVP